MPHSLSIINYVNMYALPMHLLERNLTDVNIRVVTSLFSLIRSYVVTSKRTRVSP